MNKEAVKSLLFNMADDALIIGHRNSEWTGIGPMLEEDLAFSSMAQDKIGHAQAYYEMLHEHFGLGTPDQLGFMRKEHQFRSAVFTELPIGEYDFSLVRHFLFSRADLLRIEMLAASSFQPLAQLAQKIRGEVKYHVMHGDVFLKQLAQGTEESKARMQSALNYCMPFAFSLFEPGTADADLQNDGIFAGEAALEKMWLEQVSAFVTAAGLKMPEVKDKTAHYGGRKGLHSEYLKPLLDEMCEVVNSDPGAEW